MNTTPYVAREARLLEMALVGVAATIGCLEQPETAIEPPRILRLSDDSGPVVGDWTRSEDGVLSIRLRSPRSEFAANEPLIVVGEIPNDSERPISVFKEVLSHYTLSIFEPEGKLHYTGAVATVTFGPRSFVELLPGQSIERQVALTFRTCRWGNSRFSVPRFQADLACRSPLPIGCTQVDCVLVRFLG